MEVKFTYPGFTTKAITFTIDDGNIPMDKKFIDIVKPAGIKGSFNLNGAERLSGMTPEEYREFYRGFEVTNHCKRHPKVILPTDTYEYTDEPFDMASADRTKLYSSDIEGLYYKFYTSYWGYIATPDTYIRLVDECKSELEEIFGKGSITAFVWPYHEQADESVKAHLAANYTSVRRTGLADFNLPEDRQAWCYNATHANLLERAAEFDSLESDSLTFLAVGVHAIDFERAGVWHVLEQFAREYGNRPGDYYYATVGEIFAYEDATKALTVTDTEITNPTSVTVYAIADGRRLEIPAGKSVKI